MNPPTQHDIEQSVINKLEELIKTDALVDFSKDEARVLQKFAKFMLALSAFGSVGKAIQAIIVWIGIFLGAWFAIQNGVIEFILGVVNK